MDYTNARYTGSIDILNVNHVKGWMWLVRIKRLKRFQDNFHP